ncbi:MAG: DNA polymerase III subunit beta, partial [Planctomycetota bacterium]
MTCGAAFYSRGHPAPQRGGAARPGGQEAGGAVRPARGRAEAGKRACGRKGGREGRVEPVRALIGSEARRGLLDALSLCGRVVPQRSPVPILGCVLLKAAPGGGLRLAATDLDGRVEAAVAGVAVERGGADAAALPYRYFAELVRQLPPGEEAVLEVESSGADVRCAGSRHRVAGADPTAFPEGLPGGAGGGVPVPAQALRDAGRQVAVCASDDISRPALTGVLFEAGAE